MSRIGSRRRGRSARRTAIPRSTERNDERELVEALRRGEEGAFATLIDRYGASMLTLAQRYVRGRAVAQEIALTSPSA